MAKYQYNLIVIGAGSAGLVTSYIAAALKAKVALIEKNKMGGDCLNSGCIPSKSLIRAAKMHHYAQNINQFGFEKINPQAIQFDFANIMQTIQAKIKTIEPHDSIERYQSLGVDCYQENGEILSKHQVKVGNEILTTRSIVIATGASPLVPAIAGLDKVNYLTSDNLWQLKKQPKRLVILGGGPIGLEIAQSFARLGTKVFLVELSERLLINEDQDLSAEITKQLAAEGVEIFTSHQAVLLKENAVICDYQGQEVEIEFDQLLLALGRKANIDRFGLEKIGVKLKPNQAIETNPFLQTNFSNIFALGDVIGDYQFTHTAAHQAYYACINSLFNPLKKFKVDHSIIPWAIYTDPEVARVGLNETEAKAKKIQFQVSKYQLSQLDRAITDGNNQGFVKVITKGKSDQILGVSIVGPHASETICEFILAMKYKIGLNQILSTIHIYPTLSESNKFVAGVWKKANTPKKVMPLLEKFHQWMRN